MRTGAGPLARPTVTGTAGRLPVTELALSAGRQTATRHHRSMTTLTADEAAARLGITRTALLLYDARLQPQRGRVGTGPRRKLYAVAAVEALAAARAAQIGAGEAAALLGVRVDHLHRLDAALCPDRDAGDHRVYDRAAVEFVAGERAARAAAATAATEAP